MREDQLPGGGEVEQIRESKLLARDAASATGRAAVAAADGMVARGVQPAHHPGLESAQYAAICLVRVGREIECRTRLRLMRETISMQSACNQRRDRMSCSARPLAARASRPRSARSGMPETKQAMSVAMRLTLTRNQSCTLFCLMEEAISMHSERSSELQSRIIKVACLAKRDRLVHQLCNQGSSKSHASRNGIASFINLRLDSGRASLSMPGTSADWSTSMRTCTPTMAPNPSAPVRDQSSARTASTGRRDRKQLIRRSSATISGHQGRSHLAEGTASSLRRALD